MAIVSGLAARKSLARDVYYIFIIYRKSVCSLAEVLRIGDRLMQIFRLDFYSWLEQFAATKQTKLIWGNYVC